MRQNLKLSYPSQAELQDKLKQAGMMGTPSARIVETIVETLDAALHLEEQESPLSP
ncbi:MAG: hypothetical protein FWF45_06075 [Coriobacteriia bacterium]|nr:hypothetical protein [Coriobacteriia bacterium]